MRAPRGGVTPKQRSPVFYELFEFNTATPDAFTAECDRLGQPYRVLRNGGRLSLRG